MVLFKIKKISFDWGRSILRILTKDMKEKVKKDCRASDISAEFWHGDSSEPEWDMLNLAGYRVLITYYYIPSMTWIEIYIIIWSYRPNELIKLKDAIYLLRQKAKKNHLSLSCAHCTLHIYVNTDKYVATEVYVFKTKGPDTNKAKCPRWSSLSECLGCSFLKVLHPENFKTGGWGGRPHRISSQDLR